MGFVKEFKEFAIRGNVMDLAIAVIIGGAFGKIVASLVADILMPPIGILLGGMDFTALAVTLNSALGNKPAVTLNYGKFIQSIVDFLIIAFSIFLMVKGMNKFKKKSEETTPDDPQPTNEEILLTEIRDILKQK